jgi:glycosyltransferase involved in cell wall biosynthesis
MKIGVEAKWLFRGPPSGRRVVRNLVSGLADIAQDDEIHLFLDARGRDEPLPANVDRAHCHYVWAGNNQLSNVFVVSRLADRLGLDSVVYQNFVPPRTVARHARVAFVHDAIFEEHPSFFTWQERLYFKPLRFLTSTADRVCTVSSSERERLVRYGYATLERVDVVPNAVDNVLSSHEPRSSGGVLEQHDIRAPFVLYVGRVNARKNIATLVQAMKHLSVPDVQLVIAGAIDRTAASLPSIVESAGVRERTRLLGAVDDDTLRALYATASVFCFPSLDEGFGLSPLEAMACGVPTIVSDRPALRETCGDGAIYIDPMSAPAIARAIDDVLTDASKARSLKEAGMRRATGFTWERSARLLLASAHEAARSLT